MRIPRSLIPIKPVVAVAAALVALAIAVAFFLSPDHLGPRQAQASGGNIQVVDSAARVNFPGGVALTLVAKGDADIVEVRVLYRPVGGRVWGYAYPEFQPNTTITATQVVPADRATYIPAGAELEYYYEIRDSLGNVFKSEPAVVEYLDGALDWQRTEIGPLTLLHYGQPKSRVSAMADIVAKDLERVQGILQLPEAKPIKGVIYNRASDAEGAFPQQSRTTSELGVFQGFAFPAHGVFVGMGLDRQLIVHESAHLLMSQALGDGVPALPSWLDEGFAVYVEPGAHAISSERLYGRSLPLTSMNTVSGTPDGIAVFYQKAHSVVSFMIDEYGEERFQSMLAALRAGQSVDQALKSAYGFGIEGLDARWAGIDEADPAAAPAQPQPIDPRPVRDVPSSPSPFVDFSTWVLGALALVVLALVAVRGLAGRLRPTHNPEEGLQPWEDPDLLDRELGDGENPDGGPPRY